jgi:hypothetical protein
MQSSAWDRPLLIPSAPPPGSADRVDFGSLPQAPRGVMPIQIPPGAAEQQPKPPPQLPQSSCGQAAPWWLAAASSGGACSPPPAAIGSPPKRARLDSGSALGSTGLRSGGGAASLPGSSIGSSLMIHFNRPCNTDTGDCSCGASSSVTASGNGYSEETKGGGMDCDWGAWLHDVRLLEPLSPAPAPTAAATAAMPIGMEL